MPKETHCLICGGPMDGCQCPRCGFDLSLCAEFYPTLTSRAAQLPPVWTRLDQAYRELLEAREQLRLIRTQTDARQNGKAGADPEPPRQDFGEPKRPVSGSPDRQTESGIPDQKSEKARPVYSDGVFRVSYDGHGACTLLGTVEPPSRILRIPVMICGLRVTGIREDCFRGNCAITVVYLPPKLQWVGPRAFSSCSSLRRVYLPYQADLRDRAFENCPQLRTVFFLRQADQPDGTIAGNAFSGSAAKLQICAAPGTAPARFAIRNGIYLVDPAAQEEKS